MPRGFFECVPEIIAVAETALVCDPGHGQVGIQQQVAGLPDPVMDQVFPDAEARTILMCIITYRICSILPLQHGIGCLIVRFLICIFVPNIIFIAFSYKMKEYSYAVNKIRQVLKKKVRR